MLLAIYCIATSHTTIAFWFALLPLSRTYELEATDANEKKYSAFFDSVNFWLGYYCGYKTGDFFSPILIVSYRELYVM